MATTIERAVWLCKAIADGNYGYSQPNRYGEYGKSRPTSIAPRL